MRASGTARAVGVAIPALVSAWVMAALVGFVGCSSSDDATAAGSPLSDAASDASATEGGDGAAEPFGNVDPKDIDPMNGDPSLDIAGSWIYFDKGQPWVRVEFQASWPPPTTLYFWTCSVLLGTANAPVVTYTMQTLNGTQATSAEGIEVAKVTFAAEPKGFRVLFTDTSLVFDRYGVECSLKKTKDSDLAQDTSGTFDVMSKKERTFGP